MQAGMCECCIQAGCPVLRNILICHALTRYKGNTKSAEETVMKHLLSTKEVAKYLGVNEKMVYALISEKGLPATKATGKWLFPSHLVEQWIESRTMNYPRRMESAAVEGEVLVVAGSNDILLDRMLKVFMERHSDYLAAFCNLGSLGGLKAVRRGQCHIATSHLMENAEGEYNFAAAAQELDEKPAVVNFCYREQGFVVAKGNPRSISGAADITQGRLTVVNRPLGTGTRLLFDTLLTQAGADPHTVKGYENEAGRHMDVGIEVLAGRADTGMAIRTVAARLDLGFVPVQWERFDLIIPKEHFFDKPVQLFLGLLNEPEFHKAAEELEGYDTSRSGRVVYPGEAVKP